MSQIVSVVVGLVIFLEIVECFNKTLEVLGTVVKIIGDFHAGTFDLIDHTDRRIRMLL